MNLAGDDKRCRAGDGPACNNMRVAYREEGAQMSGGQEAYRAKAYEYAKLGCDAHDDESCRVYLSETGILHSLAEKGKETVRVAHELCDKKPSNYWCELCTHDERGKPIHDALSRQYMAKACQAVTDEDPQLTCAAAAHDVLEANKLNASLAISLYEKGCKVHPQDCISAGELLLTGDGIPRDAERAAKYFTTACKRDRKLCGSITDLRNEECNTGTLDACFQAAQTCRDTEPTRARTLYEKACQKGHGPSCDALKTF